jgi:hypothetical protein
MLLIDSGRRQLRIFGALLVAANLLLPLGQIVYAEASGKNYSDFFWGEWNAITWFSSVQLLLVAALAYANHQVIGTIRNLGVDSDGGTRRWIWFLFAAGFVFLSLDERFGFHEYLRDDVFRPRDMFNVPFLRDGDVSLYFYLAVGMVLGLFLLAELRRLRTALFLFGIGVGVAAASVVVDTLAKEITRTWIFSEFWTSAFEEICEIWAQMFFAFSFMALLDWRLSGIREAGEHGEAGRAGLDAGLVGAFGRQTIRVAGAAIAINVLLPLGTFVYASVMDRTFWRLFADEDGPTEWFSSVQCLAIAAVAWANYAMLRVWRGRPSPTPQTRYPLVWIAVAVGFTILGLDERFDLHEQLRDAVLRPAGLFLDVPYIVSGDVGLYIFLIGGIALLAPLIAELRHCSPAFPLLCASFLLGIIVVVIDSLADPTMREWPAYRFWDNPFEEVGELWAQLLCLLAFLKVLQHRVTDCDRPGEAS